MTGRSLAFPLLLLLSRMACAQDHITPGQYAFHVDSNLVYGTAPNYVGIPVMLTLDLYKPLGNTDDARPLLVLVHGGSWLAGCKNAEGSGVVGLARAFAARGYVVASVNYRLGYQKSAYVASPAGPPVWPGAYLSLYASDTLEMVRALYRAQQDVKGAIRWLKARSDLDSTCSGKTFVGGESAGAFNSMAVGFLDRPEEKPASCGAIPDAPVPGTDLLNLTGYACGLQVWSPTGTMLQRPDLGPVDGTLNLNGTDPRVSAVISLFGGVPTDALALDWWQGVDTPSVYLFHQSCDGIVPFNMGRPYQTISGYCNLGATPWHSTYPIILGSNAIKNVFQAMPDPPNFTTDFITCDPFNSDIAVLDCIRYGNNGSYHSSGDLVQRAANIAAFLEPLASDPFCSTTGIKRHEKAETLVFPQPAMDRVQLSDPRLQGRVELRVMAMDGHTVMETRINDARGGVEFTFGKNVSNGIYLVRFQARGGAGSARVLVQR